MNYCLHPEAENDLRDAASFYRDQADAVLSHAFLTEFERTMRMLLQHPRMGAQYRKGRRRFVMRRFPFSVIYNVSGEEIQILAIAHHSRRPGFWRDRK